MTCDQLQPHVFDIARGEDIDSVYAVEASRHVSTCPACAALFDREHALSADLRRLAATVVVPAPNAQAEQLLLAHFDAAYRTPRSAAGRPAWPVLAAASGCVAIGLWIFGTLGAFGTFPALVGPRDDAGPRAARARELPSREAAPSIAMVPAPQLSTSVPTRRWQRRPSTSRRQTSVVASTEFMPWPGAAARPAFESGELIRINVPASVLNSLGLWSSASPEAVVQADVVIGQDGYARAIRLAQ